ncbi:hypothetical protein AGLY_007871 [Aphis glycines]|uniref:Uncharacterized protein n=1 Tax=Aphis glycines TaxID=307491 RepID=A0A6G0TQJ1_APHGL|nr:hypothetical protein AGLY_007871 [Aphis glycines]
MLRVRSRTLALFTVSPPINDRFLSDRHTHTHTHTHMERSLWSSPVSGLQYNGLNCITHVPHQGPTPSHLVKTIVKTSAPMVVDRIKTNVNFIHIYTMEVECNFLFFAHDFNFLIIFKQTNHIINLPLVKNDFSNGMPFDIISVYLSCFLIKPFHQRISKEGSYDAHTTYIPNYISSHLDNFLYYICVCDIFLMFCRDAEVLVKHNILYMYTYLAGEILHLQLKQKQSSYIVSCLTTVLLCISVDNRHFLYPSDTTLSCSRGSLTGCCSGKPINELNNRYCKKRFTTCIKKKIEKNGVETTLLRTNCFLEYLFLLLCVVIGDHIYI